MRKSFTQLSSLLVLMLLSFQMALAVPELATNGLSPADGGEINPNTPVFTLTFKGDVQPGEGQIIGLYSDNATEPESKSIQLRAVDKTTDGDAVIYEHADGTVTFEGNVVTITFNDVEWSSDVNTYWITLGTSAIQDGDGNFNTTAEVFDGGSKNDGWDFKSKDLTAPEVTRLTPEDDAEGVATNADFGIHFDELVKFAGGAAYEQQLEDFAIYTATFNGIVRQEEGGDLVSKTKATLNFFKDESSVDPIGAANVEFDSIHINWDANLESSTSYYVRVKPNMLEDLSGNAFAGFNNETDWNITTKDSDFAAPEITAQVNGDGNLMPNSEFYITYDEQFFLESDGTAVDDGDDLKEYVTVLDANNDPVTVKSAKKSTIGIDVIITVILDGNMQSDLAPYTVAVTAGDFLDESDNPSKAASEEFAAGNWDAPVATSAYVTSQGGTSFDFYVETNEAAELHYVVVPGDADFQPDNFSYIYGLNTVGAIEENIGSESKTEYYYNYNFADTAGWAYGVDDLEQESNLTTERFFGTENAVSEVFAYGTLVIEQGGELSMKRISNLPKTHGEDYAIYYTLVDPVEGDIEPLADEDAYFDALLDNRELLSDVNSLTTDVYTVDTKIPEVWFDGDSVVVDGNALGDVLINKDSETPDVLGAASTLAKNGKIYLNFNEEDPIFKYDGSVLTEADIKASLFVYEGLQPLGTDLNSDVNWSTNYGYTASYDATKNQIVITPDSSWASSASIWVKIRNSKIEDEDGNELVPYGNLYTQEFVVEDYIAPLVRYTYNDEPLDSMVGFPFESYVDGEWQSNSITVTVSEEIFVYPGAYINGENVTNDDELMKFTSYDAAASEQDDQYIGNFFKIRAGSSDVVALGTGDAIEDDFIFTIDYRTDSCVISITPKDTYIADSEVWYLIEMEERIQDANYQTIGDGASVTNANRPDGFKFTEAPTGNATDASWDIIDVSSHDNQTVVFKSEDTRNPELTFFTKKQSTLLSDLVEIDGKTVAIDDTIGVYIDEYVSLGFDSYFKFDELTDSYELDANAMRRYFQVYDENEVQLDFDVVDIDTSALADDSLVFFIDPYYADSVGINEADNFNMGTEFTVYFNSEDVDDNGIEDVSGKEKGTYWDDNNNMVLETWAVFNTAAQAPAECVSVTIEPTPGATDVDPGAYSYITFEFGSAFEGATSSIPDLNIAEGSAAATPVTGELASGNSNIVQYPVSFNSDSLYTITFAGGDIININSGIEDANEWPLEGCDPTTADTTWTYQMMDATAPALDTLDVTGAVAEYGNQGFTIPTDDSTQVDMNDDIIMIFDEDVTLVRNKALTIYDSGTNAKVTIYAQFCEYGLDSNEDTLKNVIVVPSDYFKTKLDFETNYHINVDAGFVKDVNGNAFAGISEPDLTADGATSEDGDNDWSFRTGSDPAPYFAEFLPADATDDVQDFTIEFSEPVYATGEADSYIFIHELTSGGTSTTNYFNFRSNEPTYITPNADNTIWTIDISAFANSLNIEYGKQYVVDIDQNAFEDSEGQYLTTGVDHLGVVYDVDDQTDEAAATWYVNFSDVVHPYIANEWPRDGAEHVPYNAYIYLEFNEPVAIWDGTASAIVPDADVPSAIKQFITLTAGGTTLSSNDFVVEFVANNKKLLRITPLDPDGYEDEYPGQPTMQAFTVYNVDFAISAASYTIVDGELNAMDTPASFSFTTEDVEAPEITAAPLLTAPLDCDNVATFGATVTEDSDTAIVYYAVLPSDADAPLAGDIFAQSVNGAVKHGIVGIDIVGGTASPTFEVDMGTDFVEDPEFKLYAVVQDDETDIWTPMSSDWDSLFFFSDDYDEQYDRIQDIEISPNQNITVMESAAFRVWDDDAPQLVSSYPVAEQDDFPVGDSIHFWFSEDVVAGDVTYPDSIYLRRYDNNIAVASTVTWNAADSSFYIEPTEPLEQETKYYVEWDRYAIEDENGVCTGNTVYYPQMIGRDFWFETEDNVGPRLAAVSPADGESCVSCPDLNVAGNDTLSITFYDANPVVISSDASDPYIYLYREGITANAWDVIPASEINIEQGSTDTTWVATAILTHEYYPNDLIKVVVPEDLFADDKGNTATNLTGTVEDKVWYYTTCNTDAPLVAWSIHSLNGHFNYSEATGGIEAQWDIDYETGNYKDEALTEVPTHIALKVDFGEQVEIETADDTWEVLGSGDVTEKELMKVLSVSGLDYDDSDAAKSDIDKVVINGNTVLITFQNASDAANLPIYELLADASTIGTESGVAVLEDYYGASLESETTYSVSVAENKIRATDNCVDNDESRFVKTDILEFTTRDDNAPTVAFENANGDTICDAEVCVAKDEVINIVFDKPVVKSSYDIRWLGEESYSFDNLPLLESDLTATGETNFGEYIEFYPVTPDGTTTETYTRGSDPIEVNVIELDDEGKMRYQIQPKEPLESEGWYQIVFNKHTVKKYEGNNANGTVFEGDSCYFQVGDYLAPVVEDATTDLTPDSAGVVGSDTKELKITFDEKVALGEDGLATKIRREDGSVYAEFVLGEDTLASVNGKVVTFTIGELEEHTKYYVEMPEGFITDDDSICTPNKFEGFSARLDASDGKVLSADWWFETTDAMPPQLISVDMNYTDIDPNALFPQVGDTVSMYSNLELIFDENIDITDNADEGIVIYYDNGGSTFHDTIETNNFGNAIEFIPWNEVSVPGGKIEITGTDKYNKLDNNKIVINPETVFNSQGTYYVRVDGNDVFDGSGNAWSESDSVEINPVRDYEWYFTIVNDVAPVLVNTTPEYDGVDAAGDYGDGLPATDKAYVQTDLVMEFYDAEIENGGEPLMVSRGDNTRMLRIFEYTYDAEAAGYESKPWIEMPITDSSIEFDGNKVIVNDVILKDGIRNLVPDQDGDVTNDSAYYVTVDPGAVLNGYDESSTWWPGIEHGFRWRFTTQSDTVFVDGYEIMSPKGEEAVHQTIEAVDSLVVAFNEGIGSLSNAEGQIVITDLDGDSVFAAIDVQPEHCADSMLYVDISDILVDEKNYAITVQAGAFGDTATIANPNFAFGGADEWFFHTGDNTRPVPDTTLLYAGEDCAPSEFVMEMIFDETLGVDIAQGQITFKDTSGADVIDPIPAESLVIDSTLTIVTAQVAGLPDTTDITVTLSEGLFVDRDTISPLENPEVSWTFRTGDNSGPVPTLVEPSAIVETAEVEIQITFNEAVDSTAGWVNVNGNPVLFTTEDDTIYSALVSDKLLSDQVNVISFSDSSFFDTAICGSNVVDPASTLEFDVADIDNPVAEYYPNGEYPDKYYKGIELLMVFNDNVSPVADKDIYIFDADTDEPVDTIAAEEFTSEDDSTYAALVDLYYGSFYVLADSGSFVDSDAVTFAQDYNGIVEDTVWAFDVVDTYFDPCIDGLTPARAEKGVETTTTISINFCGEESIMPAVRGDRYVTIGDQSDDQVLDENYFIFEVADSMIEGSTLTIEVDGLKENTTYSIIVAPGAVTDEAGNEFEGVTSANDWIFTTGDFTAPVATLEAGSAIEGDDAVATMTSTENGTLYLVEENVDADVTAMEAAVDNNTAVAITAIANTDMLVSVSELAAGTYNAVAVDEDGNTSERSDNAFVIESSVELTIAEIQGDGDATPYDGEIVKTSGTVTGIDEDGSGFFMQDANDVRSGIYVYDSGLAAEVGVGTDVKITATAEEYYELTQLSDVISYEFTGKIVDPVAINITASEIGEDYEGVLVKVDSLKTTGLPSDADNTEGEWYTADTENDVDVTIDEQLFTYVPDAGQRYNITGVVNYTWDEYKLAPTQVEDIDFVSGIKMLDINIDIYPNPFDTYVKFDVSRDVEITKAVITNIAGQLVKQVDYPENTIRTDELRSGVYFISLQTEEGIAKTERIIKR